MVWRTLLETHNYLSAICSLLYSAFYDSSSSRKSECSLLGNCSDLVTEYTCDNLLDCIKWSASPVLHFHQADE